MGTMQPSLSNILFSKVRQRVLGLLYSQPDRSFHTKEIIRLSRSGSGAVQRELSALSKVGLITVQPIGNQKHYAANRVSPLFSELRSIILKTFGLADVIREALLSFNEHIKIAFIYGSIAKQEDTTNSDIDLLLICDKVTYADLFTMLEKAEAQLGRNINPTFYSQNDWIRKLKDKNNFLMQINKQPKIFIIGSEDELAKLG